VSAVHVSNLLYQLIGVSVAALVGNEYTAATGRIAAERQHIIDSQKIHLYKGVLRLLLCESAAQNMRHDVHVVLVFHRSSKCNCSRAFSRDTPLQKPVRSLRQHLFIAVRGEVDIGRLILKQRLNSPVYALNAVPLQRRQQLKGEERLFRIPYKVNYSRSFHYANLKIRSQPSCRLLNGHAAPVGIVLKLVAPDCDIEI